MPSIDFAPSVGDIININRLIFRGAPMKSQSCRLWSFRSLIVISLLLGTTMIALKADSLELTNGDRYTGRVLSVTLTNVSLRSDVQGLITLPRSTVARITFGQLTTNSATAKVSTNTPAVASSNRPPSLSVLPNKGDSARIVSAVQNQMLTSSDSTANERYTQMAEALLSGKLSIPELRRQAAETLKAVEQAKQGLGSEVDDELEGYLAILRSFLGTQEP